VGLENNESKFERIPVAEEVKELLQQNSKVLEINAQIVELNSCIIDRLVSLPVLCSGAGFSPYDMEQMSRDCHGGE